MVDGISFNPYTGKEFTAEEIAKLDSVENGGNGDGKVSADELKNGLHMLSNVADEEGVVDFSAESDNKTNETQKSNPSATKESAVSTVSDTMKTNIILNSGFGSDYRNSKYKKAGSGTPESFLNSVKFDLQQVAAKLQSEMKANLGEAYNDESVQKNINSAISSTLKDLSKALCKASRPNTFMDIISKSLSKNNDAENLVKKSAGDVFSRGSASYSVRDVIDKFINYFNQAVENDKNKTEEQKEIPAPFNKNEVLASNTKLLGDYYNRPEGYETQEGKDILTQLSDSLKSQIAMTYPDIPTETLEQLLDKSVKEILVTGEKQGVFDKVFKDSPHAFINKFFNSVEKNIDSYLANKQE